LKELKDGLGYKSFGKLRMDEIGCNGSHKKHLMDKKEGGKSLLGVGGRK